MIYVLPVLFVVAVAVLLFVLRGVDFDDTDLEDVVTRNSLSRFLYLASRTTRDVEVATGDNGPTRLLKRLLRRQVTRRVGREYDKVWRWQD